MRLDFSVRLVAALVAGAALAGAALFAGAPPARAQADNDYRYPFLERRLAPVSREPRLTRPRPPRMPEATDEPRLRPAYRAPVAAPAPAPTVVVRDAPQRAPVEASVHLTVIGDSLAEFLGAGLADIFAEDGNVAVTRRARSSSGLVRADVFDWAQGARDAAAAPRLSAVVMMAGANDRQPLRGPDGSFEFGEDGWRPLYAARVDAVIEAVKARGVPLVWVGLPRMQSERYSADLATLNAIVRERVERAGESFVDVWDVFVDADGRYSAFGPEMSGRQVRLRTGDGIHFTKAGSAKLAHFAERELKRRLPDQFNRAPAAIVAIPGAPPLREPEAASGVTLSPELHQAIPPGAVAGELPLELRPGGVERAIDAMVRSTAAASALGELIGAGLSVPALNLPLAPPRPLAGPIVPLTGPPATPGGVLLSSVPAPPEPARLPLAPASLPASLPAPLAGGGARAAAPAPDPAAEEALRRAAAAEAARAARQALSEGRAPTPKPGRADDFSWPR